MGDEADYRIEQMLSGRWSSGPVNRKKYECKLPTGDTPMGSHKLNSVCAKGSSSMFNITSPAQVREGMHSILYGEPKVGKTSTLDDPVLKVLVLDLEGGSAVLEGAENVQRINIKDEALRLNKTAFEVLTMVFSAIENGELAGYDLYAIDSITEYENMVKEYIVEKYAPNRNGRPNGKFGGMQDWGDLKDLITRNVRYVHTLTKRGEKSVHMMWIAHVGIEKDPTTGAVLGTKVQLQGGNTAQVVMSIVDGLFYMYKRQVNVGTNEEPKWETERGVLTNSGGTIYNAEVRQSKRAEKLPARIPNPVWSKIYEQLGYTRS